MKLRNAIVLYRAKNRMSMQAFAEKCGVTAQTIYNVETVGQKPSRVTKAKIEIVLGDEYKIDEENEE